MKYYILFIYRSIPALFAGICFFVFPCAVPCLAQGPASSPVWVVPDERTFLHALAQWTPRHRFPIFIGETPFLEYFLRSYRSDRIVYAQPVLGADPIDKDFLLRCLLASWREGGLAEEDYSPDNRWKIKQRHKDLEGKPGMVLSHPGAPELLGAMALASGHVQYFDFLFTQFMGRANLGVDELPVLRDKISHLFSLWDLSFASLGDDVDYLTLALDLPFVYGDSPRAVDDAVNRCGESTRIISFHVGRLLEAQKGMALYQAMCSLFLSTGAALFYDEWPDTWRKSLRPGHWAIADRIPSFLLQGHQANIQNWKALTYPVNPYGLLYINSFGDTTRWGKGTVQDIPNTAPCVVFLCHNESAAFPQKVDTLAGAWLSQGAFLFFGSVSEPLVGAFPDPNQVMEAILDGEPVSSALLSRRGVSEEFRAPWRLVLLGDPLFLPRLESPDSEDNASRLIRLAITELKQGQWEVAAEVLHRITSGTILAPEPLGSRQKESAWLLLDRIYQALIFEQLENEDCPHRTDKNFWRGWWEGDSLSELVVASRLSAHHQFALKAYRKLLQRGQLNAYERQRLKDRISALEARIPEE